MFKQVYNQPLGKIYVSNQDLTETKLDKSPVSDVKTRLPTLDQAEQESYDYLHFI